MTKQTIALSQYTAAYISKGAGIPVILLHGFFGDCWTLEKIAQELATNYHCISLDLLGFGDSSKPQMRYLIEHQVAFVQEFVAVLGISQFYLVGYSYGGWVAAAYAVTNPTNLASLVLLAPAGIRDDAFVGRHKYLKPLLWKTSVVEWTLQTVRPLAQLTGQAKFIDSLLTARQAIMTQPVAASLLTDRLHPEDAVDTVEQDIDRVTTPTLVIAGECDRMIPLWHSQTYADKIPQAQIEIIPTAEHDLTNTHYLAVTQTMLRFWNSL